MNTRQNGFTLLEIIIVVAIIAMVAAIAIPSLLSSRSAANETKAIGALKAIGTAQTLYRNRNQTYASSLDALARDAGLDSNIASSAADYSGYKLEVTHPAPSAIDAYKFGTGATPFEYKITGDLTYYSNVGGVIWKQDFGASATAGNYPSNGENADTGAGWQVVQ